MLSELTTRTLSEFSANDLANSVLEMSSVVSSSPSAAEGDFYAGVSIFVVVEEHTWWSVGKSRMSWICRGISDVLNPREPFHAIQAVDQHLETNGLSRQVFTSALRGVFQQGVAVRRVLLPDHGVIFAWQCNFFIFFASTPTSCNVRALK